MVHSDNTDYTKVNSLYPSHVDHTDQHASQLICIQYHQVIRLLWGHVSLETDQQGGDNDDGDLKAGAFG